MKKILYYKIIKKSIAAIICIGIFFGIQALAINYNSTNFGVTDPAITSGLAKTLSSSFGLGQSVGQSVIGKSISTNFQVWSGFQYFRAADTFIITGTAGDAQVALSWVAPLTYLGARVGSYELGVGSISGSYVFQDIGAVTSFTKTGLTNGVQYFFILKAKTAGGSTLSFSNEIVKNPVAATNPGGGGGGGGGGNTGNAAIIIKGLAYPGAQVVILKDSAQQVTTTADQGATFAVTINNLAAAKYTFAVYAQDKDGQKSTSYSFPVTLAANTTVEIDNVFLSPTISVSDSMIKKGDPLGIFGFAAPNTQVNVYVHSSPEYIEKVNSSSVGAWFKQFDTSFLALGDHVTFSRQVKAARVTEVSQSVAFVVGDKTIKADTACGRSDLNCDKKVNITDLSMLLYYWKKTPPVTSRADINKNNIVDATDFSIMLYDWTG